MLFNPQTGKRFDEDKPIRVKIEDIDAPFVGLVNLLLKLTFAAIPAGLVMAFIYYIVSRMMLNL